jgi:alkylation response protein AidB-like acyl-CoA dehydrogenase
MRYQGMRLLAQVAAQREPGPESSLNKVLWSEYHRRFGEIAIDILGADALVRPPGDGYPTGRWQDMFFSSRADTIVSGTSEIQRDVIAEQVLGLPRELESSRRRVMGPDG